MKKDFSSLGFPARFREVFDVLVEKNGPGFGQIEFANLVTQRSGVVIKQPRVSTLLNGRLEPSLKEVEMLATALGVSPGWLAFGEGVASGDRGGSLPPSRRARVQEEPVTKTGTRKRATSG